MPNEGERLRRLGAAARDWTPVLRQAGALLAGAAMRAFKDQRRGRVRWPARAVPNRAGILADIVAGRGIPSRRFEARPAAVDTGRLRGSITWRISGADEVRIGTNVPYAGRVQNGGTSTIRLPDSARKGLAKTLRAKPDLCDGMGFLFTTKKLTITTPPRPFLTVESQDVTAIKKLVRDHVTGGP